MIENPLFSVLVANYNNGEYLHEAIDSVRNQTYAHWEIIIVDDGSTDNSHELYRELEKDNRIHIYYNDVNRGCGFTKRRCVKLASGEICGFLDPDDVILQDALEIMVETQLKNQHVSLVLSRYYFCNDKLEIQGESRLLKIPEGLNYFTYKNYMPEVFATFKKSFYDKTEGLSPDYLMGVDQDLYFKLEEVGELKVLNKFTYKYRIHDKGISNSNHNRAFYWNLIVRHDVCKRRNLKFEEFTIKDYLTQLDSATWLGQEQIKQSKAYRLGKFIIRPFKFFKS
jgi:glycosyltransferase involved in cell wall biosynthesis